MDPRERSRIYNGASDAFSRAIELVATPLIFGYLGHRLDLWLGTGALFAAVLAGFCLGYVVWKLCVAYRADMERLEAEMRTKRPARPARVPAGGA
ncbi:MAG TPA: AtpZ/AtpI family protein [Acidimicrobiales bacterium]|nr:AtpZ/AtpI family protein [Acidimicrobiales bacterium]